MNMGTYKLTLKVSNEFKHPTNSRPEHTRRTPQTLQRPRDPHARPTRQTNSYQNGLRVVWPGENKRLQHPRFSKKSCFVPACRGLALV